MIILPASPAVRSPTRRVFVKGLAASGIVAGLAPWPTRTFAEADTGVPVLSDTEFDLVIEPAPVNITGAPRMATLINGSLPAPTLRWKEGQEVTIRVTNRLPDSASIHWHGILLPSPMDGVPGLSYPGIPPGSTFTYRFRVRQHGTYWYHSHTGMQEQTGMYGAIVIEPAAGESIRVDREHVIQFSDWTDENPLRVFAKLKAQSDYYNYNRPTAVEFFRDVANHGVRAALAKRQMWNEMRMNPTDLADVSGATYTFLANGRPPAHNWTGLVRPDERVRLRFINGAANTFFDVRIPGLPFTIVQADGQDVEPVTVDEFRFGPGETCDVVVVPKDEAYTVFAQSMDRSGHAQATLATRQGLTAPVPAVDAVVPLAMADMMGDMSGDPSVVHHARTEYGPSVDMRVNTPRTNLDDPGVGLRDNGRRVLTYADLHTRGGALDPREASREIELHLTGNMERYTWSFDGVEFGRSTPVHFRYGERLKVTLQNDTMMTHPMHLHGMWSELLTPDEDFQVRKHTIAVQPAQRVSFLVNADAPGRWAWHCHLLFHMDAGMFREVVVS
ncbi:MAG: copper resistance system multicopper oxidase [Betaproteobacteria bacterium]|nr:copper resistance system multicopper oxidase [Betaproteobacteria bacterium]